MSRVIHVVPQLPPTISGVGDYATLVGRRMENAQPGLRCGYVACSHRLTPDSPAPLQRNVTGSSHRSRLWPAVDELSEEIGRDRDDLVLVLHYSGYGYDPHGAPEWLADALERRQRVAGMRIVTMFHELYATAWPWRRAFWYSARQRAVAIRIARASDAVMSNREQSARWLERVSDRPGGSVPSLPVPSNVGEPESLPAWETRPPKAVAFGSVHNKAFMRGAAANDSAALLQRLQISELVDIGQPAAINRAAFERCGVMIRQIGYCNGERVSDVLLQSRIGFVDYPFAFLGKSGVVAAYAAHGLAIFNAARRKDADHDATPVFSSEWLVTGRLPTTTELASAAYHSRHWYREHHSSDHARTMLQLASVSLDGVRV